MVRKRLIYLGICLGMAFGLGGCGTEEPAPNQFPTLEPILQVAGQTTTPNPMQLPTVQSTGMSGGNSPSIVAGTPNLELSTDEQYRLWMEEARVVHPYTDSVDLMWNVMICESSGRASIEGPGGLIGLFQYLPATWEGDWNPYRDQPITDAKAQIFATAKAWSDGLKHLWAPCL